MFRAHPVGKKHDRLGGGEYREKLDRAYLQRDQAARQASWAPLNAAGVLKDLWSEYKANAQSLRRLATSVGVTVPCFPPKCATT